MQSLVQKFRNLLEASWALSPTMVGMACLTLDLAALLHWRLKATQGVSVPGHREVHSSE
jgi:hypothetical protein